MNRVVLRQIGLESRGGTAASIDIIGSVETSNSREEGLALLQHIFESGEWHRLASLDGQFLAIKRGGPTDPVVIYRSHTALATVYFRLAEDALEWSTSLSAFGENANEATLDASSIAVALLGGRFLEGHTHLRGVRALPTGTILTIGDTGVVEVVSLADIAPGQVGRRHHERCHEFRHLLGGAVRAGMSSSPSAVDDEVALLFSGGLDSTVVAVELADLGIRPTLATWCYPHVLGMRPAYEHATTVGRALGLPQVAVTSTQPDQFAAAYIDSASTACSPAGDTLGHLTGIVRSGFLATGAFGDHLFTCNTAQLRTRFGNRVSPLRSFERPVLRGPRTDLAKPSFLAGPRRMWISDDAFDAACEADASEHRRFAHLPEDQRLVRRSLQAAVDFLIMRDLTSRLHSQSVSLVLPFLDARLWRFALALPARSRAIMRRGLIIDKWLMRSTYQGLICDDVRLGHHNGPEWGHWQSILRTSWAWTASLLDDQSVLARLGVIKPDALSMALQEDRARAQDAPMICRAAWFELWLRRQLCEPPPCAPTKPRREGTRRRANSRAHRLAPGVTYHSSGVTHVLYRRSTRQVIRLTDAADCILRHAVRPSRSITDRVPLDAFPCDVSINDTELLLGDLLEQRWIVQDVSADPSTDIHRQ
jgi:hypothetical protein